jgi:TPR repeat protein
MQLLTRKQLTLSITLLVLLGLMVAGGPVAASDKEDFDVTKIYASHGDAKAQYRLGLMYATGKGTSQDLNQAAIWYRKAAEEGNAEAQYQLGSMYDTGKGLPQNFTEASFWYNEAAEQGQATAQLGSDKIKQDFAALQTSAEKGAADAQVSLGKRFAAGNGVAQDDKQAVEWYRKAADQGYAEGQCNLGLSYAEGKGVAKDYAQAVAWYRKAAEQGNAEAQYMLGSMYHKGRGVPQSSIDAYAWLSLAASQKYAAAVKNKDFAISRLTSEQQSQALSLATDLQAMIDSKKP